MKKTIKNIQKISLVFFLTTGALHIGSNLFIANQIFVNKATLIYKILDIPFILTGVIYATTSLRLLLTKENANHKNLDITLATLTIVIFIALLGINIFLPNLIR